MEIKGLKEKLGVTDDQLDNLRTLRIESEMRQALMIMNVWRRGGNIHGINETTKTKRRKANKEARKQRKINRG